VPRRALAALLSFAAVLVAYELLSSVTGVPRAVGPIIATAVSAAVTIDSPGLFRAATGLPAGGAVAPAAQVSPEG
jgi:hypothetical protein